MRRFLAVLLLRLLHLREVVDDHADADVEHEKATDEHEEHEEPR